jgi:hypothetical protein
VHKAIVNSSGQPVMNRVRGLLIAGLFHSMLDRGLQESTAKESGQAEGLLTSKGCGRCRPILWRAVTGGRLSRNSVIFRPPR